MISIFNGRSRTLGESRQSVFAQIDVEFRQHLRHLKGAKLHVLLAIALHADEDGWAWPSYELLASETGYNEHTIARALSDLCELTILGHRVLLRFQPITEGGQYMSNRYLIFPTAAEVDEFEVEKPSAHFVHAENPHAEKVHTNQSQIEEEPDGMVVDGSGCGELAERLMSLGVHRSQATKWARERDPAMVLGWIAYVLRNGRGLKSVPSFLVAKLRDGEKPPMLEKAEGDRRRYIEGPYSDLIEH